MARQNPSERNQHRCDDDGQRNEYARRIHQDESSGVTVEAVELPNGCGQSEQVILRHLKDVLIEVKL